VNSSDIYFNIINIFGLIFKLIVGKKNLHFACFTENVYPVFDTARSRSSNTLLFITYSVLRQVHSLFQSKFSREDELILSLPTCRIFSFLLRSFSTCLRLLALLLVHSICRVFSFLLRSFNTCLRLLALLLVHSICRVFSFLLRSFSTCLRLLALLLVHSICRVFSSVTCF
jgi:hypothetical protein